MTTSYICKKENYPFFRAYLLTSETIRVGRVSSGGTHGDGTDPGFKFDTIDISGSGTYDNVTNYSYTVPMTGLYYFNMNLNILGETGDNTAQSIIIFVGFNINNNKRIYRHYTDPENWVTENKSYNIRYSITVPMNMGDTIKVYANSPTADTDAFQEYQGGGPGFTFFEGYLVSGYI